jgi:hypothetical protein
VAEVVDEVSLMLQLALQPLRQLGLPFQPPELPLPLLQILVVLATR